MEMSNVIDLLDTSVYLLQANVKPAITVLSVSKTGLE